jgi:hypothetical protein
MKKLIWFALLWSYAVPVQAAIFDITMTVDNGYGLYAGTPDSLVKIGESKTYNILETYSSDFSAGQYVPKVLSASFLPVIPPFQIFSPRWRMAGRL